MQAPMHFQTCILLDMLISAFKCYLKQNYTQTLACTVAYVHSYTSAFFYLNCPLRVTIIAQYLLHCEDPAIYVYIK